MGACWPCERPRQCVSDPLEREGSTNRWHRGRGLIRHPSEGPFSNAGTDALLTKAATAASGTGEAESHSDVAPSATPSLPTKWGSPPSAASPPTRHTAARTRPVRLWNIKVSANLPSEAVSDSPLARSHLVYPIAKAAASEPLGSSQLDRFACPLPALHSPNGGQPEAASKAETPSREHKGAPDARPGQQKRLCMGCGPPRFQKASKQGLQLPARPPKGCGWLESQLPLISNVAAGVTIMCKIAVVTTPPNRGFPVGSAQEITFSPGGRRHSSRSSARSSRKTRSTKPGAFQGIVPRKLFDRVQRKIARREDKVTMPSMRSYGSCSAKWSVG